MRSLGWLCVKGGKRALSVAVSLLRICGISLERGKGDESHAALLQRVARRNTIFDQRAAQLLGTAFGGLPTLPRLRGGKANVLRVTNVVRAQLSAERSFLGVKGGKRGLGFLPAARELGKLGERSFLCDDLRLKCGNAARLIIFTRVELLFERGGSFAERLPLFAGGDECCDAPLKLSAGVDRQAALADKSAALVNLTRDAEQRLAAVSGGQAINAFAAAGVDGGKTSHGAICSRGVALKRDVAFLRGERQRAAHRRERPGGIAVLVCQHTAFARRKTIEHYAEKGEQCRFSGFIWRFYDIKTA